MLVVEAGSITNLAATARPGHDFNMQRRCEICSNFLSEARLAASETRVEEHVFGGLRIALCATHSHFVRKLRVSTLGGLRYLFQESNGRRSLVARRRSEANEIGNERRRGGRRASDRFCN